MKTLKEWAWVVSALESGDQSVILRKGGILEAASGFVTEAPEFLLFPTWEHQDPSKVRPDFARHVEGARRPREGINVISSYARVVAEADVAGDRDMSGLSGLHILSDSHVEERRRQMPSKPLRALLLRVYRIPEVKIQMSPGYAGCRSWIDVDVEVPPGRPALDDRTAASRLEAFRRFVA